MLVCFVAGLLSGCSFSAKPEVQAIYGYAMGTSYSIKVVSSLNEARTLQLGVEGVLSDIDARMSTYLPTSDISKFGAVAPGESLKVSPKTAQVMQKALAVASRTGGAFDPTIEPLVDLWGFGPTARNSEIPSAEAIKGGLALIGWSEVSVNIEQNTLSKSAPRQLDLSAIAKGYAVDSVADYIESKGFDNYLVEVGGEMRFSGQKPENEAWSIAIEKPVVDERSPFRIVKVSDGAMATSGDYRNYFEMDGKRFSHTIDPKTGYPVEHNLASVTVVMDSCMEADAYATAFNVLGVDNALTLAESLNVAVFLIYREENELKTAQTAAFTERFGSFINE